MPKSGTFLKPHYYKELLLARAKGQRNSAEKKAV